INFSLPGVCDTDTILHRGRVPASIVIVGGGPVGVEFATICHALGSRVTLLDRGSRLMTMMDAEVSGEMAGLFEKWGINVTFGVTADSVESAGGDLEIKLSNGETIAADTLLFAAGRVANTEQLGLAGAGVNVDARGRIVVDTNF